MLLKDNPILMQLKQKSIDEKKSRGEYVEEDTAKVKVRSENKEHREHRIRQNIQKVKISADANSTMEQGVVKANDRGFGFLESESRESFFIPPKEMKNLMHGDKISGYVVYQGEKSRVERITLIEPFLSRFVARVAYVNGKLTVVPDHPCINFNINAVNHVPNGVTLREGDWVIAVLTKHALSEGNRNGHMAEVIEFIVHANDEQTPWWVVLRGLDLPKSAPEDLPSYEYKDESLPRVDLTDKPFVTIDSAKTQDMDDALYIESLQNGGWCLWVAIADPTGYIHEDDELDSYAARRAFSIYLPGRDIPMLTRTLSDDLCSLRENEERFALVGKFNISADGSCDQKIDFMMATIKSHGKLVYDEVSDLLEGKETSFSPSPVIREQIDMLRDFSRVRYNYRKTNACVFKDKPEYEFVLNENGGLKEIKVVHKRVANGIVEEAMILANTCAGRFLAEHFNAGIFNTHSGLDHEKIADVNEVLEENGYPIDDIEQIETMTGYCKLKRWLYDSESAYLDARIHKCTAFAEMSPVPGPHFGMGLDYYATWTSPIRKYGDMINHRLIKSAITNTEKPRIPSDEVIESMNLSKKSNRAAERQVKDWLYMDYLKPHINKTVFEAEVMDVSRGGIKAMLLDNGARVFVPTSMICNDKKRIEGNNSLGVVILDGEKKVIRLGQKVQVRIVEINESRAIIGELIPRIS
jgi:exoribonuclease-2